MPFNKEQCDRISSTLKRNDLIELDAILMTQVNKPSNLSEKDLCLKVACRYSLTDVIKKYLSERIFSNDILYIALYEAVQKSNIEIIRLLIDKYHLDQNKFFDNDLCNANEIADSHTPLDTQTQSSAFLLSIAYFDKENGKELLDYFLDLKNTQINRLFKYHNKTNMTALLFSYQKQDIVKLLLEKNANPFIKCEESLMVDQSDNFRLVNPNGIRQYSFHDLITSEIEQNTAIKELYKEWLSRNQHRVQQLLSAAALNSDEHPSDHLLITSSSTSSRAVTSNGQMTALHIAASDGDLVEVKKCVTQNADINSKNSDGLTPFQLAYRKGHQRITEYLFDIKLKKTQVKNIPENELQIFEDQKLGEGSSAWVYKGLYNNQPVAVKLLKNSGSIDRAKEEIKYITAFDSPYIVKAHGVLQRNKEFALILHYYPSGSLAKLLFNSEINMPSHSRERIIKDIAHGLGYVHSLGGIHGDLKPENVLLQLIDNELRAVIIDFDTLKQRMYRESIKLTVTIVNSGGFSGTRGYFAPELIAPRKFNLKIPETTSISDVYSFGVLAYTIAKREMPFPKATAGKYEDKILNGKIPKMRSEEFSTAVMNVIQGCMKLDREARLTMRLVINILEPEIIPAPSLTNSDKRPLNLVTSNLNKLRESGSKIGNFFAGKVSPRPQTPPATSKSIAMPSPRSGSLESNNNATSKGKISQSPKLDASRIISNTNASPTISRSSSSSELISEAAKEHEINSLIRSAADNEKIKLLYDTGGITFNCKCDSCKYSNVNYFHYLLWSRLEAKRTLAKYIINHSKFPVNINITNRKKQTVLHELANTNYHDKNEPFNQVRDFFNHYGDKYSIDVNAKDQDGNTPLHLAGAIGNTLLVIELLNHDADSTIKNEEGLTPYDYAAKYCKNTDRKVVVLAAIPNQVNAVSSSIIHRNAPAYSPAQINKALSVQQAHAKDHAFRRALVDGTIEELKAIYDLGKVTFNCNCSECMSEDENVLQHILYFEWKKEIELARYIIEHSKYPADINIVNRDKRTFLHLIAMRRFDVKNEPFIKLKNLFLNYEEKYFIDINAKDKDGNTPLHLAGANGNIEIIKELLDRHADFSIVNQEKLAPYEFAAIECKDPIKRAAVLAILPKAVTSPLANSSDHSMVNSKGINQLNVVIVDAQDHEFRDLLNDNILASGETHINQAKRLYDAGKITFKCNCNKCAATDKNVLQFILCFRWKEYVDLAMYMMSHPKYPVNINIGNKDERTILHLLAQSKVDAKNEPLIKLKNIFSFYGDKYLIDVNAKDKDGNTPLHLAGANGNAEMVSELLKRGADYSITNNAYLTPYEYVDRECKDPQNRAAVLAVMPKLANAASLSLRPPNYSFENIATGDIQNQVVAAGNLGIFQVRPALPVLPVIQSLQEKSDKAEAAYELATTGSAQLPESGNSIIQLNEDNLKKGIYRQLKS